MAATNSHMDKFMQDQKSTVDFNQERASSQDKRLAKLAPMRDALHLFIRMVLGDLPANARVLCVGVGTGPELIDLAQAFPHWHFTAVEPSAPMLDICRQRAQECGFASRCTFHEGYLDTLAPSEPYDAALCLLVSHFIMETAARRAFFREIAARLRPEGYLVSADLASDTSSSAYKNLFDVWVRTMKYAGIPAEEAENIGHRISVLSPPEIEALIISSGFSAPVLFFQSLLIHAWYSKALS